MKRYVLIRTAAGCATVDVRVTRGTVESRYPLRHLVRHSPTGIEWGYGGSGPSDLARSTVGDLLGTVNPDSAAYQQLKWDYLVEMPTEGGEITEQQVLLSIAAAAA